MTAFPQTALAGSGWSTVTMPSGFNSLANAASILSTGTIDNTADPQRFDYILLDIGLGSFTASAGALMVPIGSCFIDSGPGAKVAKIAFRVVAPAVYKVCVRNSAGAAFAASGNSVAWAGVLRETRTT